MVSELDFFNYGELMELAGRENYELARSEDFEMQKADFTEMLRNYLDKILTAKAGINETVKNSAFKMARSMKEFITGNYEIGLGTKTFEECAEMSENLATVIANTENDEIKKSIEDGNEELVANSVVSGSIMSGIIQDEEKESKAKADFEKLPEQFKNIFKNSVKNIIRLPEHVSTLVAHVCGLDREDNMDLNKNILGKTVGGIFYELASGTLITKRHFTDVKNSESMMKKIEEEGIVHFTSAETCKKILDSGKVRKSSRYISDLTKPKSFFFAGVPSFEDLLINIPAYDVMTAVKIKPTPEQMQELKYRALDDRAVTYDGDFNFSPEQAEIAYYGLMYDKEKGGIYLGELTPEEAKYFKVSDEVFKNYHFSPNKDRNDFMTKLKMNTYGMYAQYRHHQRYIQFRNKLEERGISFRDVDDKTLVELADIGNAYVQTKDKSSQRANLLSRIKEKISTKEKTNDNIEKTNDNEEIEENNDERL